MRVRIRKFGVMYWIFVKGDEISGALRAREVYVGGKKLSAEGVELELIVDKLEVADDVAYLW